MFRLTAVVAALLGLAGQAWGASRTENFDVDPGWSVLGTGINGNDFGYRQESSHAGGSPGEGGGRFTRSEFVKYYADTNLDGTITLDTPFSASGRFDYAQANNPDFGYTNMLGYFSTIGDSYVGIGMNYDGHAGWIYWRGVMSLDAGTEVTDWERLPDTPIGPNTDRTWSFSWDPSGGSEGGGLLTVALDEVSNTAELTPALRSKAFAVDAFGWRGGVSPSSNPAQYADIFFDDLTYTVVPEPSSVAMVFMGAFTLIAFAFCHCTHSSRGTGLRVEVVEVGWVERSEPHRSRDGRVDV